MEIQDAINLAVTVGGTIGVPLVLHIIAKVDKADKRANEAITQLLGYRAEVAEKYVSLERFDGFEDAILRKLDRIEEKIDRKADK